MTNSNSETPAGTQSGPAPNESELRAVNKADAISNHPAEMPTPTSRFFTCSQISLSALVGFIGAGVLIALNLYRMGHKIEGSIVILVAVLADLSPSVSAAMAIHWFWLPPLLSYVIARCLFQWEYAPYQREFPQRTKQPGRIEPIWIAFIYTIVSWALVWFIFAICMDIAHMLRSPSRQAANENAEIRKAPALPEPSRE